MSSNKRIFYACQAVAITNYCDDSLLAADMVHGVQSIGIDTKFNLDQAFELGQIEIYENIEGTPDIQVTLQKVLDGYPLIYHMATVGVKGTANSGLAARSKQQCDLRLGIFDEESSNVASAAGTEVEIYCSGLYVSNVSYTIPVEGNATEDVTLVGNNKTWLTGTACKVTTSIATAFNGTNSPLALGSGGVASGGIQRREDVMLSGCIFPRSINGVVGDSYGNGMNANGDPRIHIQSFSCSTDFSREDVFELGRKTPYYRPASFPVEVSTEIEAITTSGDFVTATEAGNSGLYSTIDSGNNTQAESIFMLLRCGYAFDLGAKNRLAGVTYGGGDATGGNVSTTYSYTNFNELDVQDWQNGYIGFEALKKGVTDKYAPGFPTSLIGKQ
jgi:hypothetical protein